MTDLRTPERGYVEYPDDGYYPDDFDDVSFADYGDYPAPAGHRWRPVAVIASGVFLAAVVATAVILTSGSDGSTATVVGPPPTRTVVATPAQTPSARVPTLPPETMTTLTPAAPPQQPSATPSATAAPQAVPAPPAVNPRTVVYTVAGTKQLLDLVSVVYTDAQGLPHTEVNVTLPWTKTVVLDPGVGIESVTATSLFAKLNCSIVNAAGQTVAVSASNSMIATCTR